MTYVNELNKLKMNLKFRGVVNLSWSKILERTIECLAKYKFINFYTVIDDKYIQVDLSTHNIHTVKGCTPRCKYNSKALNKLMYSTLYKNQGYYIISNNNAPFIYLHTEILEKSQGGVVIGYVE
jgi:ribosomal protein S8